jgi:Rrf2 family protein
MVGHNPRMHVPAKVEYAIQAAAELAAAHPGLVKAEQIANAQQIPPKYLQNILTQLRNAGLLESHRGGTEGGYRLARPADQITLANIIRAVAGPLTTVRGPGPNRSTTRTRPATCQRSGSRSRSAYAASWTRSPWPTWSPAPCPARSATSPTTRTPGSPTSLA